MVRVNNGLGGELAELSAAKFSLLAGTKTSQTGILKDEDAEGGLPSGAFVRWARKGSLKGSVYGEGGDKSSRKTARGSFFPGIVSFSFEVPEKSSGGCAGGGLESRYGEKKTTGEWLRRQKAGWR